MKKTDLVKNYILNNISVGKWRKGSKIFSENQLSEYLKLSRGTVRHALKEMVSENILENRQGSGYFIKSDRKYKNNIIIFIREKDIQGDITESFKYVFNKIKENIELAGYTPISYIENKVLTARDFISQSTEETIAGAVSIFGSDKNMNYFREKYIPCISTCQIIGNSTPSVLLDYLDFFFKLKYLIGKYSLNDIVIFSRKQNLTRITYNNKDSFFLYAIEKYFEKYSLYSIPLAKDNTINAKHIRKIISELKRVPDGIIFLDDTLYNTVYPYFSDFDHIMGHTKIITHFSHVNKTESEKYKPCKIVFNLDLLAEKTVDLLLKFIRGEHIDDYNIFIKPIIENEDVLE